MSLRRRAASVCGWRFKNRRLATAPSNGFLVYSPVLKKPAGRYQAIEVGSPAIRTEPHFAPEIGLETDWRPTSRNKAQPGPILVLRPFELEDHIDCGLHLNSGHIENRWALDPGVHCIERSLTEQFRQARCLKGLRICFAFSISRTMIIKTSSSYFACASSATTAATFSSIWFQPSS